MKNNRPRPSPMSRCSFKVAKAITKIKYAKTKLIGIENIPEKNTIIVANHAKLNGPIIAELFMPKNCYIWANGQMVNSEDVPDYAMKDFFAFKKKWQLPIFRVAAQILARILPCVMENARVIPVYRDVRFVSTLKKTINMLVEGRNILIFPECHEGCNNIINRLQDGFVQIARLYYKRTGICLTFVPMYISPELHRCYFGKSVIYDPASESEEERRRITDHIATEITRIGRILPEHKVVPFDNIPKKRYISNKSFDSVPE